MKKEGDIPPPKPRQNRKRKKVEGETIQNGNDCEHNNIEFDVVETLKRPCRRRRNDGINHNEEINKVGVANGDGTSLLKRRRTLNAVAEETTTSTTSNSSRKTPSVLRRLAEDSLQNNTRDDLHTKKNDMHASKVNVTDDQTVSTISTHHNNILDSTAIRQMEIDNLTSFASERRKLHFLLLSSVILCMMVVVLLSAIIYTNNFNHNLTILQRDAQTAHKQSDIIQREMNESTKLKKELERSTRTHEMQMKLVTDTMGELKDRYQHLLKDTKLVSMQYDMLQHNCMELANVFFAPVLIFTKHLQQSNEQQQSIIADLTSMVHSLHSSLEIKREELETQRRDSVHAVDAVALASTEVALLKAQSYEFERSHYMEQMEMKLEMLEYEAFGAVQAVANAAGKLEYDRKVEEEGRWRSYTEEVESILNNVQVGIIHNDIKDDGTNPIVEKKGNTETSVLKSAISRRIEEGIISLRSYIHPYNYLNHRDEGRIGRNSQSEA